MSEQICPDCAHSTAAHFDATGQFTGCPTGPTRVMIRRWGLHGRVIDIGGLAKDALIAITDEMRDGMVRVVDLLGGGDYWAPLDLATRQGSRKVSQQEEAEGLEHARMMLGRVSLSRSLRGCGERALGKGR